MFDSKQIYKIYDKLRIFKKIYASHFHHNPASGKVLEKNGFVFEAELKQEILKNGKYLDLFRYALFNIK